jgi:hypothetical protein
MKDIIFHGNQGDNANKARGMQFFREISYIFYDKERLKSTKEFMKINAEIFDCIRDMKIEEDKQYAYQEYCRIIIRYKYRQDAIRSLTQVYEKGIWEPAGTLYQDIRDYERAAGNFETLLLNLKQRKLERNLVNKCIEIKKEEFEKENREVGENERTSTSPELVVGKRTMLWRCSNPNKNYWGDKQAEVIPGCIVRMAPRQDHNGNLAIADGEWVSVEVIDWGFRGWIHKNDLAVSRDSLLAYANGDLEDSHLGDKREDEALLAYLQEMSKDVEGVIVVVKAPVYAEETGGQHLADKGLYLSMRVSLIGKDSDYPGERRPVALPGDERVWIAKAHILEVPVNVPSEESVSSIGDAGVATDVRWPLPPDLKPANPLAIWAESLLAQQFKWSRKGLADPNYRELLANIQVLDAEEAGQVHPLAERFRHLIGVTNLSEIEPTALQDPKQSIQIASKWYKWAMSTPDSMDNSAFLQLCLRAIGIHVSRHSSDQYNDLLKDQRFRSLKDDVDDREQWQRGDVICFVRDVKDKETGEIKEEGYGGAIAVNSHQAILVNGLFTAPKAGGGRRDVYPYTGIIQACLRTENGHYGCKDTDRGEHDPYVSGAKKFVVFRLRS